jgi:hypothetical protein
MVKRNINCLDQEPDYRDSAIPILTMCINILISSSIGFVSIFTVPFVRILNISIENTGGEYLFPVRVLGKIFHYYAPQLYIVTGMVFILLEVAVFNPGVKWYTKKFEKAGGLQISISGYIKFALTAAFIFYFAYIK